MGGLRTRPTFYRDFFILSISVNSVSCRSVRWAQKLRAKLRAAGNWTGTRRFLGALSPMKRRQLGQRLIHAGELPYVLRHLGCLTAFFNFNYVYRTGSNWTGFLLLVDVVRVFDGYRNRMQRHGECDFHALAQQLDQALAQLDTLQSAVPSLRADSVQHLEADPAHAADARVADLRTMLDQKEVRKRVQCRRFAAPPPVT